MAPMRPRAMLLALLIAIGTLGGPSAARAVTTTTTTVTPPPPLPAVTAPPPSPPVGTAVPGTPVPSRVAGAATDGGIPAPLWVLAGLAVLAAVAALSILVARTVGWAPAWAPGARHAWGEAGFRAGSRWADFRDFLRARR